MRKRLQVLFDGEELAELQEIARQNHMTLATSVRQTLREARARQPFGDAASKHRAVREAMQHKFPTTDIDEMIVQIGSGYGPSSN